MFTEEKQILYWAEMLDEAMNDKTLGESLSGAESTKFRNKLKKGVVKFSFMKKNGEKREAAGTLKKSELPSYETEKRPKNNPGRFVYWDVDRDAFRCFIRDNFIGCEDQEKPEKDEDAEKQSDDKK